MKRKVLVVEDDPLNAEILTRYINKIYEVDTAANGYQAIEKTNNCLYDALLLDIQLGDGPSGIDIAMQLRQRNEYHDTPIIAVTAFTLPADRDRIMKSGFTHFLSKPVSRELLLKVLRSVVI